MKTQSEIEDLPKFSNTLITLKMKTLFMIKIILAFKIDVMFRCYGFYADACYAYGNTKGVPIDLFCDLVTYLFDLSSVQIVHLLLDPMMSSMTSSSPISLDIGLHPWYIHT